MNGETVGIDLDDLQQPPKAGIVTAAQLGFRTVEMSARGDLSPERLDHTGRRHLKRMVAGNGLELSALTADMGGNRLTDPAQVDRVIERTRQVLELAAGLGVPVVTASCAALTDPESGAPHPLAVEALRVLAEHADRVGALYAIRPTWDDADGLERVFRELGAPSLRVGIDPAALVMSGVNPLQVVERFGEAVSLAHIRDATAGSRQRSGHETGLGEGEVDLVGLLASLSAADYSGPHILRRREAVNPRRDLAYAREVLERLLPPGL